MEKKTCCVWAPQAGRVEIDIGSQRLPLIREKKPEDMGWWQLAPQDNRLISHGTDYAFYIDGNGPLPDPRSAWQPRGVHGPSRFLDHSRFDWLDIGWQSPPLSSAVIYELHVGTFTPNGTFDAIIEYLDHLQELGVTHVELMPVNGFSGSRGWGYDGVNLYAPQETYGGPEGLKRLVDACHASGLAVILDVVYNHLGPEGNYLGRFGPYFTDRYRSPWGQAVNFDDAHSDEVRRFFCDNALMWLRDYHIDGLRIDAVHAIIDTSAIHFLRQLAIEVETLQNALCRHLYLIAESDLNNPRLVQSREAGGYGLAAQWSDDLHHALHALLSGEHSGYYQDFGCIDHVAKALKQVFVYDGCYSQFRQRRHGRPIEHLPGYRFLGYLQTHDQVGNRAKGERLGHLISTAQLKIAAALVLTAPFIPMLFQGEEWNASTPFLYFTDHQDPELGETVRSGRRTEFSAFGWRPDDIPDPQALETFEHSKLNWDELKLPEHSELLHWYQRLIELRRKTPELKDGNLERMDIRYDEQARWLVVRRPPIIIAVNLSPEAQSVPLAGSGNVTLLLASAEPVILEDNTRIGLPTESVAILKLLPGPLF